MSGLKLAAALQPVWAFAHRTCVPHADATFGYFRLIQHCVQARSSGAHMMTVAEDEQPCSTPAIKAPPQHDAWQPLTPSEPVPAELIGLCQCPRVSMCACQQDVRLGPRTLGAYGWHCNNTNLERRSAQS